jgi:hypothetical protein
MSDAIKTESPIEEDFLAALQASGSWRHQKRALAVRTTGKAMTMKEKLALATQMAKDGALRSAIVRATGLTADQVNEIKERIKP